MIELFVMALAAWRLAHLLVHEDGPGAIFARLRYWAGVRYVVRRGEQKPESLRVAQGPLAEGLTCVWCVSVWAAAVFAFGARWRSVRWLREVLATSGGAVIVHEVVMWLKR